MSSGYDRKTSVNVSRRVGAGAISKDELGFEMCETAWRSFGFYHVLVVAYSKREESSYCAATNSTD
jgi:hypothetical protein